MNCRFTVGAPEPELRYLHILKYVLIDPNKTRLVRGVVEISSDF